MLDQQVCFIRGRAGELVALPARGKSNVLICDVRKKLLLCISCIYLCEISFSHKINNIQFQLLSMERIAEEMYQKKSKHTEEMLNKT